MWAQGPNWVSFVKFWGERLNDIDPDGPSHGSNLHESCGSCLTTSLIRPKATNTLGTRAENGLRLAIASLEEREGFILGPFRVKNFLWNHWKVGNYIS